MGIKLREGKTVEEEIKEIEDFLKLNNNASSVLGNIFNLRLDELKQMKASEQ